MLNIDTIRALNKTILSEMYRSLFRYLPVLVFAIILLLTNNEHLLVEVYLSGFLLLSFSSSFRIYRLFNALEKPNKNSEIFSTIEILKHPSLWLLVQSHIL